MDNNPKENCPVCFGKANPKKPFHCHYGAICCLKCRSFFRRVVQSNGTANLEKVFYCYDIFKPSRDRCMTVTPDKCDRSVILLCTFEENIFIAEIDIIV